MRSLILQTLSLNTHIPALQGRGVDVRFGASKPVVEEVLKPNSESTNSGDTP